MSGYFIFGDIDTRDYEGILVFFDDVDHTPKCIYTEIPIPARNGSFFLDEGRYDDVEHVYHIIALTKEVGSDFINALASKRGYQRLEDSFNPDEFYSAVFTSDTDPKIQKERGINTFKVTFTRKPQRFLKNGENAVTIADGDTITNPTMFDAHPLLEVEGYGHISLNGYTINIDDGDYGEIVSTPFVSTQASGNITFDDAHLNSGDNIWLNSVRVVHTATQKSGYSFQYTRTDSVTAGATGSIDDYGKSRKINVAEIALSYGTTYTATYTASYTLSWKYSGRVSSGTASLTLALAYDGVHTISYTITYEIGTPFTSTGVQITAQTLKTESTVPAVGHPTYIDLDIGVAWNEDSGDVASMNNVVELPFELPVLVSGENVISYDNTVTDLKIIPRWWKV